ncbi:MAG: PAS domain-containing sensor histidine kinase, partial [Halanaerobiales bacterium]
QTREVVENPIQKVIKTGKAERLENHTVLISKDGTEYQIADSAAPITNDDEEILGVVLVFRDVTEQYRKEEKIRKSEKKYRELIDFSPIGIFQTHSDGHVLFANPAMYKMVGTESEEEVKEYFNDLSAKLYTSEDKRNEFLELLDKYGYVEDFEFEAISKTGKHLWFKMNARRGEKDKEGNFIIDGFTVDITDLKKVTEELRKEGIFLQQLTETSPIGITKVDENGDIIYANSAAEEILGLTKDLITNRTYNDPKWEITSLDGSPLPEEELPFYRVKNEGKTVYDVRHRIKDADENIRTLSINATPIFNKEGFEGMVSTLLDISKQTRIESELKQSIEEKDMLMRELNHRVKNNLNMISSLINIKNFELQSTDLYDITAQIKAMSIIYEKIQETGNLQTVELKEYLQNLLESIFKSFESRDVEIENNIDNIEIKTKDAMALGIIVNEVATNAIKYGFNDEESRFIIDLKEDGDYYKLYLTNTGNPFPEDVDIENIESLGMQIITALSFQLKGGFELIREPNTTFVISFLKEYIWINKE